MKEENFSSGWIKLYRSIENKSWYNKADHLRIWIHLLIRANHSGKEIIFHGQPIKLKPGEVITGRKKLATELKINESKVERVLSFFEKKEHQIEQRTDRQKRIISIINWQDYQKSEQRPNNDRTTSEQRVNTNKNDKNGKNYKNKENTKRKTSKSTSYIGLEYFEKLWKRYPKKDGRKDALRHFKATVKTQEDLRRIEIALDHYLEEIKILKKNYQFIKNGSTWFNNWEDWVEWTKPEPDYRNDPTVLPYSIEDV